MSRKRYRHVPKNIRVRRRTILLALGAAVLLLGGAALVFSSGDGDDGTPRLVVEQEVFDYGDVAYNTPIETVFVLRNEGDGTLRILSTPEVELREGC